MWRLGQWVLAWFVCVFVSVAWATEAAEAKPQDPTTTLDWQQGPTKGQIGNKASVDVPAGYLFLDSAQTKKFMALTHNFGGDDEYLLATKQDGWFAVFHFNPTGYVKDDETIDAQAVLDSVKKGTEASNEERRKRGWGTMSITGWRFKPQYDKQAKLLEWAISAKNDSDGSPVVNYNTRILGRTGVMEVVLVSDPDHLDAAVADLKQKLKGYEFASGEKYAQFQQGDRVAEYGLAALIVGGAAAVATKKGFWGILAGFFVAVWKFIAVAAAGALAWLKSLFRKKE